VAAECAGLIYAQSDAKVSDSGSSAGSGPAITFYACAGPSNLLYGMSVEVTNKFSITALSSVGGFSGRDLTLQLARWRANLCQPCYYCDPVSTNVDVKPAHLRKTVLCRLHRG
jgi:hypothetical protein